MVDRVADVGRLFRESPAESQGVLRTLLAGRRIRVSPDPERRFAVDGLLTVPLNDEPPETLRDSGRFASVVAGVSTNTVETRLRRRIPLQWAA